MPSRALKVVFVTAILTHYRKAFHEQVRTILNRQGIDYDIIYSAPVGAEAIKNDTIDMPWATRVPVRSFRGGRLLYQFAWSKIRKSDLIIIGQENRFLLNYILQMTPAAFRPKIALWGHGRNFQARNSRSRAERWKRFWATRADWWFAYTDESRRHISSLGFDPARITVFNNTVDTTEIKALVNTITTEQIEKRRADLRLDGRSVCLFMGGLYPDKRIEFLVAASDHIRSAIPHFELVFVGGGEQLALIEQLSKSRNWIKVLGPRFGQDKVELMLLSKLLLMPGLVGLAVIDAAAAGLPTVTTSFPYHSPEIAYLDPNVNGVKVEDWKDPISYGDAVVDLLSNDSKLHKMKLGAISSSVDLTIEAMASRFATGVIEALHYDN